MDCVKLVNAIPIVLSQPIAMLVGNDGNWEIKTKSRTFSLRNSKLSIAREWVRVFNECVARSIAVGYAEWLGVPGQGHEGARERGSAMPYTMDDIDEALGRRLSTCLLQDESLEGMEANEDEDSDCESIASTSKGAKDGAKEGKKETWRGSTPRPFAFMKNFISSPASGVKPDKASHGSIDMDMGGSEGVVAAVPAPSSMALPKPKSLSSPQPQTNLLSKPLTPRESARKAEFAEQVGRNIAEDFGSRMVRHHL